MTLDIAHETGSGNVFADIGLPQPEEHLVKAKLVHRIDRLMRDRGLKQEVAIVVKPHTDAGRGPGIRVI